MAENLGTIACPHCGNAQTCYVRQAHSRKARPEGAKPARRGNYADSLYLYCAKEDGSADCGAILSTGLGAQARIREKAKWFAGAAPAVAAPRLEVVKCAIEPAELVQSPREPARAPARKPATPAEPAPSAPAKRGVFEGWS